MTVRSLDLEIVGVVRGELRRHGFVCVQGWFS